MPLVSIASLTAIAGPGFAAADSCRNEINLGPRPSAGVAIHWRRIRSARMIAYLRMWGQCVCLGQQQQQMYNSAHWCWLAGGRQAGACALVDRASLRPQTLSHVWSAAALPSCLECYEGRWCVCLPLHARGGCVLNSASRAGRTQHHPPCFGVCVVLPCGRHDKQH